MPPVEGETAQHDPNAGASPDRKALEASKDSFPASDALGPRVETGAVAVPVGALMADPDAAPPPVEGAVEVALRFAERDAAKLALERAVREGPLDRRLGEIEGGEEGGGAAVLRLRVPGDRAERLRAMLREAGGEEAAI